MLLKQVYIYTNIAYYSNLEIIENPGQNIQQVSHCPTSLVNAHQDTAQVTTCHRPTEQVVTIAMLANHFKNELSMNDWFLIESCDDYIKFMYLDKHFIDGIQVTRCVTVFKDLTWLVNVHNSTLHHEAFTSTCFTDPPGKLVHKSDLVTLLNAVAMRSALCPGCNSPEFEKITTPCVDRKGNLKGKIEAMSNSKQTWQTWRSSTCKHLLYGTNHKTIRCPSCSQLNRSMCNVLYKSKAAVNKNQDKENKQPISSSSVNWKLLAVEEKMKRYKDQQRRLNSERKAKYAQRKMEDEKQMVKVTAVDNDDVQTMFKELDGEVKELECDNSGTHDNDLYYWAMQREALQSGKTVWHPR